MLRLMLASPAGVPAVLTGRAAAATIVGFLQGAVVLALAPLFVPVAPRNLAAAVGALGPGIRREQRARTAGGGSPAIGRELCRGDQRGALPASLRERGAIPHRRYAVRAPVSCADQSGNLPGRPNASGIRPAHRVQRQDRHPGSDRVDPATPESGRPAVRSGAAICRSAGLIFARSRATVIRCSTFERTGLTNRPAGRHGRLHHDVTVAPKQSQHGMPDELTGFFGLLAELEREAYRPASARPGTLSGSPSEAKSGTPECDAVRQSPDGQSERVGPLLSGLEGSSRDRRKEVIQGPAHLRNLRHFIRHERANAAGVEPGSTQGPAIASAEQAIGVRADRCLRRSPGQRQGIEPALQANAAIRWRRPELPDVPGARRSGCVSARRTRSESSIRRFPETWRSPAGGQCSQSRILAMAWLDRASRKTGPWSIPRGAGSCESMRR